jgi:hypothetical protein
MNAAESPSPTPINRTAMAKETLDRLKQEWIIAGHRLGEAERELALSEKAAAHHADAVRGFDSGLLKKISLGVVGRLATSRQALRADLAKAEARLRLAAESAKAARANKKLLRDTIAELERGLKKPKLCENRLTDFCGKREGE